MAGTGGTSLWGQASYDLQPTELPFTATELLLEVGARKQLATDLALLVRSLPQDSEDDRQFSARALVIALGIDPSNRSAVLAKARFRHGDKMKPSEEKVDRGTLAEKLALTAGNLVELGGEPDKALAAYLIDLAYAAAPDNDEVIYNAEILRSQAQMRVPWSRLTGKRPDIATAHRQVHGKSTAASAKREPSSISKSTTEIKSGSAAFLDSVRQNQVNGLVVLSRGSGTIGGKVMEINATLGEESGGTTRADFVTEVAEDMMISKNEALRLALLRVPEAKRGHRIRLSFDDKYSQKAGGSAGTAFSVAIISLLKGVKLDPTVAMTGDIGVDGDVQKVGGIADKISGAARAGLKYVGIPSENSEDVGNLLVLGDIKELAKIQVYSLDNVDVAINLARLDRPENLAQAMIKFEEFQQNVKGKSLLGALRRPQNQELLNQVLELAPHHLSAKYLLNAAKGRMPRRLTRMASLEETFNAFGPIFALLTEEDEDGEEQPASIMFTSSQIRGMSEQFRRLEKKVHPKSADLFYDMRNFLLIIDTYQSQFGEVPHFRMHHLYTQAHTKDLKRLGMLNDLRAQWNRIYDQLTKLDYDHDFKEDLLR